MLHSEHLFSSYQQGIRHMGPTVGVSLFPLLLLLFSIGTGWAAAPNTISSVQVQSGAENATIRIKGSVQPIYEVFELFKPARIVVDVADTVLAENAQIIIPQDSGISLNTSAIAGTPQKTRFEFSLSEGREFKVRVEQNDIVIDVTGANTKAASTPAPAKPEAPVVQSAPGASPEPLVAQEIKFETSPQATQVQILTSGKVTDFHHEALPGDTSNPPRLFLDINNIRGEHLLKEQKVGTALAKIRVAQRGTGIRVVFDAVGKELFPYQINELPNGLQITVQETGQSAEGQKENKTEAISPTIDQQAIAAKLPDVKAIAPGNADTTSASENAIEDAFNFTGYKKERITVDFYKIDLHNVFRLLREVSGANIVVDEAVKGSLTLALNDVPWDFALDIILNLKDLVKEERFNTIVILPKEKAFNWPAQAADNLAVETDETVVMEQEQALIVQQKEQTTPEMIRAKQLVQAGSKDEKKKNYEAALKQYEEALQLWPDNTTLANRIASIYLMYLRKNPPAVHYAQKALEMDPGNHSAALIAAIALASMQENKEAQQYFDQAVSGPKPTAEALISYASFAEEQKKYEAALKLLDRHDSLYGEKLHSMLATARILDKNNQPDDAAKKYQALLNSGFRLPPDLKKYINGRVALGQSR